MPQSALVSIALCTFNGASYIEPQLESLLNQTYSNFEIIVCDDCSTDSTVSILKRYASNDSRIKVYSNETNLGFNKNFEKALSLCSGSLIAISDQDDIWVENKIERMLTEWELETVLMHHSAKTFSNISLPSLAITNEKDMSVCTDMRYIISGNFIQGCTILFKRDLLKTAIPFPEGVIYDWWLGVCAFNSGKVKYLHENLIYHRRHTSSAHFSIEKTRRDHIIFLLRNTERLFEIGAFSNGYESYAKNTIAVYRSLLETRFSLKALFWFIKTRKVKMWHKTIKKHPFFPMLLQSFKLARGAKHIPNK